MSMRDKNGHPLFTGGEGRGIKKIKKEKILVDSRGNGRYHDREYQYHGLLKDGERSWN